MWPFETPAWYLRPISSSTSANFTSKDELNEEIIKKNRVEACEFICKVARRLLLYTFLFTYCPYRTIATAQLYFQIFFLTHSMEHYPYMDIALTALLVASKAEETYKKIRQILAAAFLVLNPEFTGSDLDVKIVEDHRIRVTQYEHTLLEVIDYNFAVRHAHEVLLKLSSTLKLSEKETLYAFNFCQRCYTTPVVVWFPPEYIALAGILSSSGSSKGQLNLLESFCERININPDELTKLARLMESNVTATTSSNNNLLLYSKTKQ